MAMSAVAENSLGSIQASSMAFTPVTHERSPLVAVSLAMAVTGCLIATATPGAIFELLWPLLFLGFAIEEEVRKFEVPILWGVAFLVTRLAFLGLTAGGVEVLQAVAGAAVASGLFLPLYGSGLVRRGTLIASAGFGAIVGIKTLPFLLLIALMLGVPIAAIHLSRGANPGSFPVFTAIGLAATIVPFLGFS